MQQSNENWVVLVARNNLELLKQAVESALGQDCEPATRVLVVDNGSTDDVQQWARQLARSNPTRMYMTRFMPQHSVARAWNFALTYLFRERVAARVLVINADVVLRPDTYRWLAGEQAMFVTAVGSADRESIYSTPQPADPAPNGGGWIAPVVYPTPRPDATRPHPDFSCFMISRECFELVGKFDECFQPAWFEDNSYHIRMHRAGVRAYCIDLPFYHVGGGAQTLKRMPAGAERDELMKAFARNRELFISAYGCDPADTKAYEQLFA